MKLDRDSMLDVLKANGSIFLNVNGVHKSYTLDNIAEFPTVADLAVGNKEAEKAAKKDVDEQIAFLLAEKAKIEASQKAQAEAKAASKKSEVADSKKTEDKQPV